MSRVRSLDTALAFSETIPGWLTECQARELFTHASNARPGTCVVEIGSHFGRSTVVLATATPSDCTMVAIDPFLPMWRYGGPKTESGFRANLAQAGLQDRVELQPTTSMEALASWHSEISVLYIDGAHDYRSVRDDLAWIDHLTPSGHVLIHDSFSSVGVTIALLLHVLPGHRLRYVGRVGSLAIFQPRRPTVRDRWRLLKELPWWLRNLAIKVLLRARQHRVLNRLGHHSHDDPY